MDGEELNEKKRFRAPGAGRKPVAPEIREAAFQWFLDIRGGLKGRLPRKIFRLKCLELFEKWKEANADIDATFQCSKKWVNDWMLEYRVSLKQPNKRFALSRDERIIRIEEFLKNVLRVRFFFNHHFKKEPTIINGDQMPLHRNESSGQKTLSMTDDTTYVKENYLLSRERVTVFTQVSTGAKIKPEFLFKGKGTQIHLQPPAGVHTQFAPKGSYRLENMLATIGHLPNKKNLFTASGCVLYILDDYSVHVTEEVKQAMLDRGYILVCIGGGITGDMQVNDTHYHHALKREYREREAKLMLDQLGENPNKVPNPSRDEMMEMLVDSWDTLDIDTTSALKSLFIANALDGSEDHLVSDKLYELVGATIVAFRTELMASLPPPNVKELMKTLTPPKGVKRKQAAAAAAPEDEGRELLDCEGEEMNQEELIHEINHAQEGEGCEDEGAGEPTPLNAAEQDNQSQLSDKSKPSQISKPSSSSTSATAVSQDEGAGEPTPLNAAEQDNQSQLSDKSKPSQISKPSSSSTSATAVSLSSFATSDDTVKDAEFLDRMKDLLESHDTSKMFIPYYLNFKTTYMKARKSLKKRLQTDSEVVKKILQSPTSPEENNKQNEKSTSSAMEENASNSESDTENEKCMSSAMEENASNSESDTENEKVAVHVDVLVGQYCLVTNGRSSLPARISSLSPLAVRYFEIGPQGLHCAGEYVQEILKEDIAKVLSDPETVLKGTRIYYKFEGY